MLEECVRNLSTIHRGNISSVRYVIDSACLRDTAHTIVDVRINSNVLWSNVHMCDLLIRLCVKYFHNNEKYECSHGI